MANRTTTIKGPLSERSWSKGLKHGYTGTHAIIKGGSRGKKASMLHLGDHLCDRGNLPARAEMATSFKNDRPGMQGCYSSPGRDIRRLPKSKGPGRDQVLPAYPVRSLRSNTKNMFFSSKHKNEDNPIIDDETPIKATSKKRPDNSIIDDETPIKATSKKRQEHRNNHPPKSSDRECNDIKTPRLLQQPKRRLEESKKTSHALHKSEHNSFTNEETKMFKPQKQRSKHDRQAAKTSMMTYSHHDGKPSQNYDERDRHGAEFHRQNDRAVRYYDTEPDHVPRDRQKRPTAQFASEKGETQALYYAPRPSLLCSSRRVFFSSRRVHIEFVVTTTVLRKTTQSTCSP